MALDNKKNRDNNQLTPADVLDDLAALEAEPTLDTAKILSKPENTSAADKENSAKAEEAKQAQQQSIRNAVRQQTVQQKVQREPLSGVDRAVEAVKRHMYTIKTSEDGSASRVEALTRMVDIVTRFPKKVVLDEILQFFKENKEAQFLQPTRALQNTNNLDKSTVIKLRLLYQLMMDIANGIATRRTVSLDTIRNIFASDDLVNWVALRIDRRR